MEVIHDEATLRHYVAAAISAIIAYLPFVDCYDQELINCLKTCYS